MIRKLSFKLSLIIAMLVFISAVVVTPALADEAPPPADPVVEAPADAPVDTSSEEAVSESTTETEEVSPVEEILASIPEDTQLIVVDENGEPLPLVSEEVEEAILVKDPIWCPTGVAPKPNVGGCSDSFPSLSALVAAFVPNKSGTIWIEAGDDNGTAVVIDGETNWASAVNFNLTLQGGWIGGTNGSKSIVGVSVFDTPISIVNWNGAVTINDIVFNNAVSATYPTNNALYVETQKNIVLSNVAVINTNYNNANGAHLDNSMSTTQASVTVKNSTFSNNKSGSGVHIYSNGVVTLSNVQANNNKKVNVFIANDSDNLSSSVTVSNSSFNGSTTAEGLVIFSNGAVKLNQLTAGYNSNRGIYVNNLSALSPQPVTATGFLTTNNNSGIAGLQILSTGAVNLTNLTATGNTSAVGVYIQNSTSIKPQPVTITGTNTFNNNHFNGLYVDSKGAVTLNNLTAIYNGTIFEDAGVFVQNDYDLTKPQNVSINGNNLFQNNGYHGLNVYSYGVITVSNVTAVGNGNAIVNNDGSGVLLYNAEATIPKAIILKGTNTFNSNDEIGAYLLSSGAITISNVTAIGNGLHGAYLTNTVGAGTAGVVVTGTNSFNNNGYNGLTVYSKGAIAVNNITAYSNDNYGAMLFNAYGVQKPVTITGYGNFNLNANDGLYINSNGAITTKNLSAYKNNGNGVYLETMGILAPQAVTMNGFNTFNSNGNSGGDSGLIVKADGNITVSNVTTSYNYYNGAFIDNYSNWSAGTFPTFGSVNINGFGNFSHNGNQGVFIYTKGSATLNHVSANFNINNDGVGIRAYGKVTLVCITANNNDYGLWLYETPTVLTIKGLIAVGNTAEDEFFFNATPIRTRCP